ncbi:BTAD domain-containing putative transcriptional regulator [Kitasatospora sp. NPDC088783]|uniref:AfsR/SARP family transcriptional regulator n=1 Tax=Kitasatospora sp. NPDC088783 TaxID=3364077 RepID=UPI0037F51FF6
MGERMDLDVRLLGPLEVEAQGKLLAIGGLRSCRLLAVLLLNANSVVTADRLIDVMWEEAPRSARQQIHNTVGALRRIVSHAQGIDILTVPLGYRVDIDDERLDLTRYRSMVRRADEALAAGDTGAGISLLASARRLWRGAALAGLGGEYFTNVATRLEEERLSTVELLLELHVRRGDGAQAVAELVELVASHPTRESFRASLMTALHSSGRTSEALEVYEEGRLLLAEEFGLDPSDDLKALHQHILRGLPVAEPPASRLPPVSKTPVAAVATVAAQESAHRQFLPHDPREFSGRQDEIRQLAEDSRQIDSVSLVISAINGMGGIGKTALAVRFAHTVSPDYPDGQYFVDLRGFAAGVDPLDAGEALGMLLRQCGLPDELIPPGLEARTVAWRGAVAGKKVLLLLDNAVDVQQVRPLLPGTSGPLVLITSRRRLPALEGAVPLSLDLMPLEDAVALFTRIVGARRLASHESDVAEVVELCGRLPLAIRIAAARFRDRASWTVHYLVEQLRDQERRARFLDFGERSVSAALTLSYRHLSGDSSRLFRLLSLHPGPDFDARTASVLTALPTDRAQDILEALFDDNLVLQDKPGRYHFHDLVRDYAARVCREHDNETVRNDARRRLTDYYLQLAGAWCAPLAKGPFRFNPDITHSVSGIPVPSSAADAIELLTGEAANLAEVARAALADGPPEAAWQLVCAIQPFLRRTNYAGNALELFEGAVGAARSAKDEPGEALCLMGLSGVLRERGRMSDARSALELAVAISRRTEDRFAETYQLTELGVLKVNDESFAEAHDCFRSALALVENLADPELTAALRNNLGVVCRELGRNAEGFDHLSQALIFYQATDRDLSEAYALANIGILLVREGRFAEAAGYLDRALRLGDEGSHMHIAAVARATLCVAHRALGDLPRAFEAGRAALRLTREHQLLEVECDALDGLGETYLAAGDLDNAETAFQHAVGLARERKLRLYQARAQEGFAHIALYRGEVRAARQGFETALSLYPDGVAEAENSRAHLVEPLTRGVRCTRCSYHQPAVPGSPAAVL